MAEPNKSKALYSSGVACIGFVAFALAAAAVALPLWGYFESSEGKRSLMFWIAFINVTGPTYKKTYVRF